MSFPSDLIAFVVALLASLTLTVPIRRLAVRYGMVDRPNARKVHLKPIPLLGGIAIYLGFVLAVLLTHHGVPERQIMGILAGATLVAVTGFLDDGGFLHHQLKLFVGMPVAALFLVASGIRADFFSEFIHGTAGSILDIGLTLFWVVGITAAFSILDHMDGLCAGIAAWAAAFFTVAATLNGQTLVRSLGAAVWAPLSVFCVGISTPRKFSWGMAGPCSLDF